MSIVKIQDFGGLAEVAEAIGVSNSRVVSNYIKRHWDFPKPRHRVKATPLWYLPECVEWKHKYDAKKGKGGAPLGNKNSASSNERRHQEALLKRYAEHL